MNNLAPMLAYSAGSITLGIALTIYLLLILTRRSGSMEGSEGYLATFIVLNSTDSFWYSGRLLQAGCPSVDINH